MRHPDPDLVVAGVGRLVAEEQQVELLARDRGDDRLGGRLRVPLAPVRDEVDRPVGADRHRVAKLLLRLGRAEGQHDDLAALRLHEPHRLLDAALLVRGDREAEVARLDRLLVRRQHDPPAA